jgi:hypothetical protein
VLISSSYNVPYIVEETILHDQDYLQTVLLTNAISGSKEASYLNSQQRFPHGGCDRGRLRASAACASGVRKETQIAGRENSMYTDAQSLVGRPF